MKKMKTRTKVLIAILGLVILVGCFTAFNIQRFKKAAGSVTYEYTDAVRVIEDTNAQGVGTVEVSTLKIPAELPVRRCCYTVSGSVLFSCRTGNGGSVYLMKDDGSGLVEIYAGPMDRNYRLMLEDKNQRILLGDHMLEVPEGKTLDTCGGHEASLVPIEYPAAFVNDKNVVDKWTEVVLSNDGEYIVWTERRSNCGAANVIGHLTRYADKYVIEDARFCSSMNAFVTDPATGETVYKPVIGGEVKQFVRGGAALTLVGSAPNGNGNSVLQDLATGEVTQLTHNPGYDETTLLSPNEKYGIVMTSRFSETTDLAVLGLMDRPFGDVNHAIMDKVYMYSVTGVRSFREGNIGPAIINVERSMAESDYMGIDVSSPDPDWVYYSPMSWNHDSTGAVRVQRAVLKDVVPEGRPETVPTPAVGDYADSTILPQDGTFVLKGAHSGTAAIVKGKSFFGLLSEVKITYDHFSNDGQVFFDGTEYARGSMATRTTCTADLTAVDQNGAEVGRMDVKMQFSAAFGLHTLIKQIQSPMLDVNGSHGTARWMDLSADTSTLVE